MNGGKNGRDAWNLFIWHNDMLLKDVDNFMFTFQVFQN